MIKKISSFWKPALWLAIICYALFIPAGELPVKPFLIIPNFDKIVHFTLFFIFNLLLLRPFKQLKTRYYLVAAAISISVSGILEFSQHFISTSRQSDIFDFIANSTGVLISLLFYRFLVLNHKWEKWF